MSLLQSRRMTRQFAKYVVVGLASNALGYSCYLIITSIGVGSELGMTLVYTSACMVSFFFNKRWTFADPTRSRMLLPRYVFIQIIGYLTNLLLLLVLYRRYGFPHQWVQLLAFVVVAVELFLLSKYFVFRGASIGASR